LLSEAAEGAEVQMASFLLSLLLVIFGCAPAPLVPDEALFKTWQGKPKDELIATFGPPSSERPSEKGTTIFTWKKAQRHPSGISRMGMAESYYSVCVMEFEIDQSGVVRRATQRGCQ
jgi:hypothetical protein